MALHPPIPATARHDAGRRSLRLAWIWVAVLALSLVAAMLIGEGLQSLQGGDTDEPSLSQVLAAALPALAVIVLPAVGAIWCGLRARRLGETRGLIPVVVASVVAGWAVLTNLIGLVALLVAG